MLNSLLADHLRLLQAAEAKQFEQFLQSPYLNDAPNPEQQVQLVRLIWKALNGKISIPQKIAAVNRAIFGTSEVPSGKLDKLASATLQSLRLFLADQQRRAQADPQEDALWLADWYRTHDMPQRFEKQVLGIRKDLQERPFHGEVWADMRMKLEENYMRFLAEQPKHPDDLNLGATIHAIDEAWLSRRLIYLMTMLHFHNMQPTFEVTEYVDWFESVLPAIERLYAAHNPVIKTYLISVQLAKVQDSETGDRLLDQLLDQLDQIASVLPPIHFQALEQHALHYCHRQAYKGRDFAGPVFRIYERQVREDRIMLHGRMNATVFASVVTAALRNGKDAWAEQFIAHYSEKISSIEMQRDTVGLCKAKLFFYRKQYEEALDALHTNHNHQALNAPARTLEIQILYELDSPLFDPRLEAFKVFLFREKEMSSNKRETYNRFINIMLQLRTLGNALEKTRRQKLVQKVLETTSIAERSWLLEKLG